MGSSRRPSHATVKGLNLKKYNLHEMKIGDTPLLYRQSCFIGRLTMKYKLHNLFDRPYFCIIPNFLSNKECATIIQLAKKRGLKTAKIANEDALNKNKRFRKSDVCFLHDCHQKTIVAIEKRIEKLTKIPRSHGESFQVGYYGEGGHYNSHVDAGGKLKRAVTCLIYLNDVEEGGETGFPNLGVKVIPQKGTAVLWYNYKNVPLPNSTKGSFIQFPKKLILDYDTIHAGEPIRKGEKWIVTKWLHTTPKPSTFKE